MPYPSFLGIPIGGVFILNAIIWLGAWFVILRMPHDTFFIPIIGCFGTTWFFTKVIPSMWASFISSFGGLGIVVLWLLAIGIVGVVGWFAVRGIVEYFRRRSYQNQSQVQYQAPVQQPGIAAPPGQPFVTTPEYHDRYKLGPNELYHGTSMVAARDIFSNHRWKSEMRGDLFFTNQIEYASQMAEMRDVGGSGEIIVVHYHPSLQLHYSGDGTFIFEISKHYGSWEPDEYYLIEGLNPIHILDVHGKIIASS